jgi:uncharacterized protein Yka (UPF0111/DUF47 family)
MRKGRVNLNEEIERVVEKITNTMQTIAQLLVDMNHERKTEINNLSKRISTVEHIIARHEGRLTELEKRISKDI